MDNLNDYMYPTCDKCGSRAIWHGLWDGTDEDGNRTGGYMIECKDCGHIIE